MKSFMRIIILCTVLTVTAGNFAMAQDNVEAETFTISGTIGPGLGGVEMGGLPGNPVTDENGFYSAKVESGWNGTVRPTKTGYTFNPASMTYTNTVNDRSNQNFAAERITLTISGNVGASRVVMNGLPGNVFTDGSGYYSATVPFGFAGNVRPHKEGYTFDPPTKIYSALTSDMTNQNYTSELRRFIISGTVGLTGVEMQGLPGNPYSDSGGRYSAIVDYNWDGFVMPVKEGYKFEPPSLIYKNVRTNLNSQNYEASPIILEISGNINMPGVLLLGLPGTPITDEEGRYKTNVSYGWSGTVTPEKEGYEMNPPSRSYTAVRADLRNQDYFAELRMFTISEVVEMEGVPIPGVKVSTNDGISTITDRRGRFTIEVPYGWRGEVMLSKDGYEFDPPGKPFVNVISNIRDGVPERPTPRQRSVLYGTRPGQGRIRTRYQSTVGPTGGRRILVVPASDVKPEELAGTVEDMFVFSSILDERFKEPRMIQGVFRDFGDFFGRDNRETEAVYMQGYGVVFMMEVDYTFTPAPEKPEQEDEKPAETTDPTWQQARKKIFSPGRSGLTSRPDSARRSDGQMVEELKAELIRTLKYAANIRNIEPDEWVILSITGTGRQSGSMMMEFFEPSPPQTRSGTSSSESAREFSGGMMGGYGGGMSGSAAMGGGSSGGMMGGMGGGSAGGMGAYGGMGGGSGGGMAEGMISSSGGMGGSSGGMMGGMGVSSGGMGGYGGMGMYGGMGGYFETYETLFGSPTTVLTIRTKKVDVDAFSKGDIDYQQFRQKVQILLY